tara:strand:- start:560 stop:910 length:351 start_codon:yes stop_codon:yes gene_type:complete
LAGSVLSAAHDGPTSGKAEPAKHGRAAKRGTKQDKWASFDELDDRDIERAVAADRDAAPVDDDLWKNAKVVLPVSKKAISIRIDEDVLEYFKTIGPGYQSRMNAVLRSYMEAKKPR